MRLFNRSSVPAVILGTLIAAMPAAAIASQSGIEREVTLKNEPQVWSQEVCLQDLVHDGWIQSRCTVDRTTCCKWNLGGQTTRELSRADVEKGLSSVRFTGISLILRGADRVAVTQTHRELLADEVKEKARAAAQAKLGVGPDQLSVESIKIINTAYVPLKEESSWDVLVSDPVSHSETIKIVSTSDHLKTLGWAQVSFRLDADVYVAKKAVRPNEEIKLENFELRKFNVMGSAVNRDLSGEVVRANAFPEGVRAKQTIQAGAPLLSASLERIPMIRLGDVVTLILKSDNLRVSTKAVAQGTAAVGDMVTVQLPRYSRTFRGKLVEGRLVEVWL